MFVEVCPCSLNAGVLIVFILLISFIVSLIFTHVKEDCMCLLGIDVCIINIFLYWKLLSWYVCPCFTVLLYLIVIFKTPAVPRRGFLLFCSSQGYFHHSLTCSSALFPLRLSFQKLGSFVVKVQSAPVTSGRFSLTFTFYLN